LQCPHLQQNTTSYDEKLEEKMRAYHGAKNSTRTSFSGSTSALMFEVFKSTTSEAASARARVARVRDKAVASIDEIRILERGERRKET
jgi:hypothetical protein